MTEIIEVRGLKKYFALERGFLGRSSATIKAVDDVSFAISPGETLCLVGESGCGKSTVGKLLMRLLEPTEGTIRLDGADITHLGTGDMRPHRKRMQMVFQDPYASLNPRMTAGRIVTEPLENYSDFGRQERERSRDQDRPGDTLENPKEDEQFHVGGEPAEHRRQAKADQAVQEHALAAVVVA